MPYWKILSFFFALFKLCRYLCSYAKGQTTTEIVENIKDIYDVDISTSLVSTVTDNIIDDITAWQNRSLSSLYPIVDLDCIVVKIRQDKQIINKAIYLALERQLIRYIQTRRFSYVLCIWYVTL